MAQRAEQRVIPRTEPQEEDLLAVTDDGPFWQTELGQIVARARAEFLAENGRFLTEEEVARERSLERGSADNETE